MHADDIPTLRTSPRGVPCVQLGGCGPQRSLIDALGVSCVNFGMMLSARA
jgi:hypothetical protein